MYLYRNNPDSLISEFCAEKGELVSSLGFATDPHLFHPGCILDLTACMHLGQFLPVPTSKLCLSHSTAINCLFVSALWPKDVYTGGITTNLSK